MNRKERYSYRYLGDGFKVSNDTWETHLNNNDLIVGSSGSSKTGSIVYAQLKSLRDSSLIVEADANPNGQLDVPVRIIMDDFASSEIIPDFDKIPSYSFALEEEADEQLSA